MPMLSLFKDKGYEIGDYPNTYQQYKGEISLPIYPQLTGKEVEMVAGAVVNAYNTVIC